MLLKLYLIGVCLCIVWFFFMALFIFEKWTYDKQSNEDREAIDSVMEVLKENNPSNPQKAYLIISLLIIILWPIMIPYMIIKSKMN